MISIVEKGRENKFRVKDSGGGVHKPGKMRLSTTNHTFSSKQKRGVRGLIFLCPVVPT
jgi:hypothetical protein